MNEFDINDLKKFMFPALNSHKGENGKLLIIGGSVLFHAASLWSFTGSIKNRRRRFSILRFRRITLWWKRKSGISKRYIVPRSRIEHYINDADCILIGPGLPRESGVEEGDDDTKELTERSIQAYPNKKWVVDGGSLQESVLRFCHRRPLLHRIT